MNLSLERQIQIGFAIAVAIIVAVGGAALQSTTATVESAAWVARTLEVRADLAATVADLTDAETGERGYVITGDDRFLGPYDSAKADLRALVARLRSLTADNPAQQLRLDSLDALIPTQIGRLERTIALRRERGAAAAAAAVSTGEGKALTGGIRGLMARMEDAEGRLLVHRSAVLQAKAHLARLAAWAGVLVAFTLASLASVLVSRELARRQQVEATLRESEQRYRLLFDGNPVPAWVFDIETLKFLAVNEAAVHSYGYTRDEFRAMTITDIRPREDVPALIEAISHIGLGHVGGGIWRHRKKDGTFIDVEITSHDLTYGGRPSELVLARDVSARRRAEEALRASEERFRNLATTATDAIVSADSRGDITYFNPGAERAFGYGAVEVVGKPITRLMPERFHAAHRAGLERYLATGEARVVGKTVELAGRRKDGTEFPLELSLASWKQDQEIAFTAIIRDVTERKRAEQALRESEERFRLLVESVRDYAIYLLDPTGNVVSWNRGAQQIKGYTAEEIVGQHFSRFYTPEDVAAGKPDAALRAAAAAGRYEEENWRIRKDGSRFWADVVLTAVRDDAGTLVGFAKVTRDLTERKYAEAELQARTAQLEAANKELEAFSYSVSHDLRAPLRSIDGFSQALEEDYTARLDEPGRDHLRRVRAATKRMEQLIDDLLNLARVSRGERRDESVDLGALARSVAAELGKRNPARAVEFACADRAPARGDPRLLGIVLENLLGNAWKFTAQRQPARIEFGVAPHDGRPVYFVRDNGAGFDMAYADKLFGAFQRLHAAGEFPGTGIGLATVQRIIHRHGGRVWAEATVDRGATFYFTLQ